MFTFYYRTQWIIRSFYLKIKYAHQRVFRGYDDNAKWDLSHTLAEIIRDVTYDMAENINVFPIKLGEKKWREILEQISFGFGSYLEMDSGNYLYTDKEYKNLDKDFNKGLKLFVKYYRDLWD